MAVVLLGIEHQIFHPGEIRFLTGLVEQHHEDDPFQATESTDQHILRSKNWDTEEDTDQEEPPFV